MIIELKLLRQDHGSAYANQLMYYIDINKNRMINRYKKNIYQYSTFSHV